MTISSSPATPVSRAAPLWKKSLALFTVSIVLGLLCLAAWWGMFGRFSSYDDEGYLLVSLRNFHEHGGLYRDVYTQYGPFPFAIYSVLAALGLPLTHDGGRMFTLALWAVTALFGARLVGRVTRSLALEIAVLAGGFVHLHVMINEPNHPGGLVGLIVAALAWGGDRWIRSEKPQAWGLAVGAGIAALMLTKINVGVFAAFSAGAWMLVYHRNTWLRRLAPWLLVPAGVLLPLGLMRPLLSLDWVQTYAVEFACAAVAIFVAISARTSPRVSSGTMMAAALGFAAVAAGVVGFTLARGTSLRELLEGVVFAPLHHPTVFSYPFAWPRGSFALAILSVGVCGMARVLRDARGVATVDDWIAVGRIGASILVGAMLLGVASLEGDRLVFGWMLPLIWILVWPLEGEQSGTSASQAWLALLLLGQWLHAFPVAGSQVAWSTLLAVPLAAVSAWEAIVWLRTRPAHARWLRLGAIRTAATVGLLLFVLLAGVRLAKSGSVYRRNPSLGLTGSEYLRLSPDETVRLQLLTTNAAAHADLLFSLPGMFSLNLWSGLPTPTLANATHWFSLLSVAEQEAIIHSLAAHPRTCVIVNRGRLEFLAGVGVLPSGILSDYLRENFAPAFAVDDFEFWVRNGRKIAPLMFASTGESAAPGGDARLLQLRVVLPVGRSVAEIGVVPRHYRGPPRWLETAGSRVEITPIDLQGNALGAAVAETWPFAVAAPSAALISIRFESRLALSTGDSLVLRDSSGTDIAWLRLQPDPPRPASVAEK